MKPKTKVGTLRITENRSFDHLPKLYYKIDEVVTRDGLYITWDESHGTRESAQQSINQYHNLWKHPTQRRAM